MNVPIASRLPDVLERARRSRGISNVAIYEMVMRVLRKRGVTGETFVDVGCGTGSLADWVAGMFPRYVGVDVVRYPEFADDREFVEVDLETGAIPLANGFADVVAAVETIEHLENPRAFMRELVRIVRPGGWVIVTTPNQLSVLNILSLMIRRRHVHFQDVHYPAHLTALIEVDLRRIAAESGLDEVGVEYSGSGRIALTRLYYPKFLAALFPRAMSDNVLAMGRKRIG
jgi:2-polyprenyl-3-methyl-5-hydroxy-6-metoxy-1,4-benzoquinol methylase